MRTYSSSDYAGLDTEHIKFYYGYEVMQGAEWCFTAKGKGYDVTIPFPELHVKDSFDCLRCLLAGIGLFLDRYPRQEGEG
ncbi:MAG: hypothetical protein A2Y91_02095 [Chloroflexi bacterium RBG_13_54_8]|nr:MAG: hypothetical protein A2Y91_02095 [Chloroflexi bacterium RBG_13_54_8]